jgi:FAS-associated factor 2
METLEVDDSLVFGAQPRTRNYPFSRFVGGTPGRIGLFSILMAPFSVTVNLLSSLFHFIFRVLRIPFPRLNTLALSFNVNNRSARRGSVSDDPGVVAERWVRELEEETGAVCISKAALMDANGHGDDDDGDNEPGPSSRVIKRRGGGGGSKMKTLPDFFLGGYDAALRLAQREARVLCVILTSEEHDDVPAFRRDVLADPEFVRTLTDNHIIIWGGDVRERDAYQGMFYFVLYAMKD